jgi:hypothetical protein
MLGKEKPHGGNRGDSINAYAQYHSKPYHKRQYSSFKEVNDALLAGGLAQSWFPNARRHGNSLRVGSLAGESGASLWICLQTGAWTDHATGEKGGDLVSLYAAMHRLSQADALNKLNSGISLDNPRNLERKAIPKGRTDKTDAALDIWTQGAAMAGTPAETYLTGRELPYHADMPLKYHAACPRGGGCYPAMLAQMTDVVTAEPCGVHRTFLKPDGSGKADFQPNKMMLGKAKNAVVRLSPDDEVTQGLGIVEGIENGLAILAIGWKPVWVALSAGGVASFPVLHGIEAITVFADHDQAGQEAAIQCSRRWADQGKEAIIRTPKHFGADWNDMILGEKQ